MNTQEIEAVFSRIKCGDIFKGVFACDDLPKNVDLPAAFVINLSPKSSAGTHWVSLFIDQTGVATYFDSYGFAPLNRDILFFINMHSKRLTYNKRQIQHVTSRKCGKFASAFLISEMAGKGLHDFLSNFAENPFINDIIIEKMLNYFIELYSLKHIG